MASHALPSQAVKADKAVRLSGNFFTGVIDENVLETYDHLIWSSTRS